MQLRKEDEVVWPEGGVIRTFCALPIQPHHEVTKKMMKNWGENTSFFCFVLREKKNWPFITALFFF